MNRLFLIASNKSGLCLEAQLSEYEKQYSIGRDADIALGSLELVSENPKRRMYSIAGYITFIDGGWFFRAAKGVRRKKKAVKINGKLFDASKREVMLKHGYTISFGEDDDIVVTIRENAPEETLSDRTPSFSGLFDKVKLEFESLNKLIRATFGLDDKANTGVIMSKLEEQGLFNAAYEYNLARGLRNIIAHPSPNIQNIKRDYVYEALWAIESVKGAISATQDVTANASATSL